MNFTVFSRKYYQTLYNTLYKENLDMLWSKENSLNNLFSAFTTMVYIREHSRKHSELVVGPKEFKLINFLSIQVVKVDMYLPDAAEVLRSPAEPSGLNSI